MKKSNNVFLLLGIAIVLVSFPIESKGTNLKILSKFVVRLTVVAEKLGFKTTRWAEKEVPKRTIRTVTSPAGARAMSRQITQAMQPCPICYGKGTIVDAKGYTHQCNRCSGLGKIWQPSANRNMAR